HLQRQRGAGVEGIRMRGQEQRTGGCCKRTGRAPASDPGARRRLAGMLLAVEGELLLVHLEPGIRRSAGGPDHELHVELRGVRQETLAGNATPLDLELPGPVLLMLDLELAHVARVRLRLPFLLVVVFVPLELQAAGREGLREVADANDDLLGSRIERAG